MAVQIIYGRRNEKEISFADFNETINLTDYLKKICRSVFEEEIFTEDDEEIAYPVISFDKIGSLLDLLTKNEGGLWDELKETRGTEKKAELLSNLKDVALFKNLIIKMLLQNCPNTEKLLVLI